MQYLIILEPAQDGPGCRASVPALPEIVTEYDSIDEAIREIPDAISTALEHRKEFRLPMPKNPLVTFVEVTS